MKRSLGGHQVLAFEHSGIVEHESADEARLVTARVII